MRGKGASRNRTMRWRFSRPLVTVYCLTLCALGLGGPFRPSWTVSEAAAAGTPPVRIDYVYPEAFRQPTWIDVDLPSSQVVLKNIRVLTANRNWTLKVCGSPTGPTNCTILVRSPSNPAAGWWGDFSNTTLNYSYTDLDGVSKLHLLVTPAGGDWMIFRIQTDVQK
jgi:hypothetical protein